MGGALTWAGQPCADMLETHSTLPSGTIRLAEEWPTSPGVIEQFQGSKQLQELQLIVASGGGGGGCGSGSSHGRLCSCRQRGIREAAAARWISQSQLSGRGGLASTEERESRCAPLGGDLPDSPTSEAARPLTAPHALQRLRI